jgi:hypothetical protein
MIAQDNWHHKNRAWRRFQRDRCIINRVKEVLQDTCFAQDFDPVTKELLSWSQYTRPEWEIQRWPAGRYAKKDPYDCGAHSNSKSGHHCGLCHCEDSHRHRNAKIHAAADYDYEDWLNGE